MKQLRAVFQYRHEITLYSFICSVGTVIEGQTSENCYTIPLIITHICFTLIKTLKGRRLSNLYVFILLLHFEFSFLLFLLVVRRFLISLLSLTETVSICLIARNFHIYRSILHFLSKRCHFGLLHHPFFHIDPDREPNRLASLQTLFIKRKSVQRTINLYNAQTTLPMKLNNIMKSISYGEEL
jgi:hypothetical protein